MFEVGLLRPGVALGREVLFQHSSPRLLLGLSSVSLLRRNTHVARGGQHFASIHTTSRRLAASYDKQSIASGNAATQDRPPVKREENPARNTGVDVADTTDDGVLASYVAPLAKMFYRMKMFSLASLVTTGLLCPVLLLAPAELGMAGRLGLCVAALATSSASTSLIAWTGKPYVGVMRLLSAESAEQQRRKDIAAADPSLKESSNIEEEPARPALELVTTNWRLRILKTTVYDPSMLRGTSRPFASWELAARPPPRLLPEGRRKDGVTSICKLIATTRDAKTGALLGQRWAMWSSDALTRVPEGAAPDSLDGAKAGDWVGEGRTVQNGHVVRYFSIHEDRLDKRWQVL